FLAGCSSAPAKTDLPPLATDAPPVASATASASAVASASAPPPPSPFVAVAPLDGEHHLFPVDGTVFVAARESKPRASDQASGNAIGYVDGDTLKFPPGMLLPGWFHHIVGIDGKWPGKITMLAVGDTGRAPMAERYTLDGEEWKLATDCQGADCAVGRRYVGLFSVGSSLLGLEGPGLFPDRAPKFATFAGPKLSLSWRKAPKACETDVGPFRFAAELAMPAAVTALSDGSVVAYGSRCTGDAAVEVWKGDKSASTIAPVPFGSGEITDGDAQILPTPDGKAWLVDGAIAYFDGSSWSRVDGPAPGEAAVAATLAKDGRLWVVTKSGLYVKGKRWEMIDLPGEAAPTDVAVDRNGVMWVASAGALFRERKKDEPAKELTIAVQKQPPAPAKKPVTPGGPRCKNNLVILYGFTKVTPDDYDFPLTRKAVKGHTELSGVKFVVSKDYGKKFFAGLAPTYDVAQKLAKLVEREVKGAKPGIVCAQPEIVRELAIDLKTGDVRK
ncbi:MAG: hypothetical protein JNK04_25095, partial [Myxococcales bacterium]|nr:hypothetical protein [Myxococcales bacterium]